MSGGPRRHAPVRPGMLFAIGLACAAGCMAGCIIPDAQIRAIGNFENEGAVRIVQPTFITDEAHEACADIDEAGGIEECPGVPPGLPTGLLGGNFCTCAAGERDGRAALRFDVFVEDPDVDEAGRPADDILGVFLLDPQSGATDPTPFVAYGNYLPPDQPAALFTAGEFPTIERPNPNLRSWTIGEDVVDLCNDNQGQRLAALEASPSPDEDPPEETGLHELRIVVTDRPWYRPPLEDEDGEVMLDEDGEVVRGEPLFGVPDLGAGATYDTRSFVFRCYSPVAPPPGDCSCQAPEAP